MPRLRPTPRQRAVWNYLNDTVRKHGGWITSAIYHEPLRLECRQDSALPEALERAGYHLRPLGVSERLYPVVEVTRDFSGNKVERQHTAPTTVEIYSLTLPGAASSSS